jgi:Protein of unknown function (DUF2637)
VTLLALIAGTVSYLHMRLLVELHGQPGWVAALTPLSVGGMIVAASPTLLAYSRGGGRGGLLPWALVVAGSAASLAANVAVAEPTITGRVIGAWPSFSLIAAYELLMRQIRRAAEAGASQQRSGRPSQSVTSAGTAAARGPATAGHSGVAPRRLPAGRPGGRCDGMRGGGRRRTGPRTGRCPQAGTSHGNMAVTTGGDGWSSNPDWPASWTLRGSVDSLGRAVKVRFPVRA